MNLWRHYLLVVCFGVCTAGLIGRVAYLGVTEHDFLKEQGEARSVRVATIPVHRGVIYDRHGEPLAVSTPSLSPWVDPSLTVLTRPQIALVADVLDIAAQHLADRLENASGRQFAYLKRLIKPEVADALRALHIDGIRFQREYQRFYPAGEIAAHVVGMTDIDDSGQEGVELAMDAALRGRKGTKRVLRDRRGRTVRDLAYLSVPEFGHDVTLSLDLRLQFLAYRELKSAVEHNRAESGSLVMLDVDTGEVLALVNQPSFNPNTFDGRQASGVRNRAITDMYEPGSTVKPLAMLAALESGRFSENSVVDTSPGYFMIGHKLIEDPINRGRLSMAEVLIKSSQVGVAKVALTLGARDVFDVYARAGLGDAPGTGLPGETLGKLTDVDLDKPIARAALAYGYGLMVSPMQLALSYLTLATGGVHRSATVFRQTAVGPAVRVFEERHVRSIVAMMEGVVGAGGTAPKAAVRGYRVAGKTGTVRKVSAHGYDDERHVAFFAGFAPVGTPKIVVVVVLNEPRGDASGGGEVAAPVFSRVVARALRVLGIAPDGRETV